ncbi:MAG: ABC transporter ATP-binding protein [Oscillospiraceae bacterium]|jgi:branched-chain amino acid transport system ATP-binding protein|nr:ABC transporter ATP-binding protein [Oscillospiraceae bacterium]
MADTLLEIKDLCVQFGGLSALERVSFAVSPGEIVGLIGPNGAGKTTVFNLITGIYPPTSGSVTLNGRTISGKKTHLIFQSGVARTFQNIRLFKKLSVLDNVRIAAHSQMRYGPLTGALRLPGYWRDESETTARAMDMLGIFDLAGYAEATASSLPYGAQRRLEIARALISRPRLLLLDEPAAGMNPTETRALMSTIREVRDRFGVAILLIEHDMRLVMGICERLVVLDYGQVIAAGAPDEIRRDERVVKAYLGGSAV